MRNEGILYLSRDDVAGLGLRMADVVDAVEEAFRAKGAGEAVMPPKATMTGAGGAFAQVMPAWLGAAGGSGTAVRTGAAGSVPEVRGEGGAAAGRGTALGVKLVTVFPGNPQRGLAATNALIALCDAETGVPSAVMDGGLITALRTGAGVGVAARHLAAPGVARVGVLGCGAQARTSTRALAAVLSDLREVRCHDVALQAVAAFVQDVGRALLDRRGAAAAEGAPNAGEAAAAEALVELIVCDEPAQVCRGAGVVVSAITMAAEPAPPLGAGLLEPGALAVALDYDAAWSAAAMAECERFVTDDMTQTLATKAHGVRLGGVPGRIDADLGEVVAGLATGRTAPSERIFCLNLGIAVADIVCACLVHDRARAAGVGTMLPR